MSQKSVAIAGGGIAGFSAAASLAKAGFKVTVYEASDEPREFGAGIYLKENSLQVLDQLGVGGRLAVNGAHLKSVRIIDEDGMTVVDRKIEDERLIVTLRADLHTALKDAAIEAGAQLVTRRRAVGATPEGVLRFDDGESVEADLIIAADGVHSRVRNSLGLLRFYGELGDGATRVLIPREEGDYSTEYWSGQHRVGIAPCSPDQTYVFIIGPEREKRAGVLPLDREYWSGLFPHLEGVFARVTDDAGVHHVHSVAYCRSWVSGRVAVVGDAAHAQPPNFGQGAGLAIAATWEMAQVLSRANDVAEGLKHWEEKMRPRVDWVQRLTTAYDIAGYKWPPAFSGLRSKIFQTLGSNEWTSKKWQYYWRGGMEAPASLPDALKAVADGHR